MTMRFAYIDSQGNEVPIPSVDALALRIELGAIGPDTQLYDAQSDHWGPAHTHEIFHTLTRELEEKEEGFVAPPPVVPPPAPPPPEPVAEDEGGGAEGEEAAPAAEAPADEGLAGDLGFELTLTDVGVDSAEGQAPAEEAPPADESAGDLAGGDDLASGLTLVDESTAGNGGAGETADEPFDFGAGGIELEPAAAEEGGGEAPMDFGGGMELEQPLAGGLDLSGEGAPDLGGGLELEQPMSEFTPEAPPAWMEQEGPPADEPTMDFSAEASAEDEAPLPPVREEPGSRTGPDMQERPRARPVPPRRKPQRSLKGPLIGVGAVVVLAVGGWMLRGMFSGGSGEPEEAAREPVALPPVTIPEIPAELLPLMRDIGEDALAALSEDFQDIRAELGLADAPRDEWLGGSYLAHASQYGDIADYWNGIADFVDRVRDEDATLFHDRYAALLEERGVAADTAAMLLMRADSGFAAAKAERLEAYAQMDDLVRAALDLHDFLLANEASIEFDPAASGMSRDPVLEAVPATDELRQQMLSLMDGITGALDTLGTLDRVTTERLLAVLYDRIRRAGFE